MQSRQDFQNMRLDGWRIFIENSYSLEDVKNILPAKIDSLFSNNDFEKVPASRFARVYKTTKNINGQNTTFYIKKFLYRSSVDVVKHLLRPSRGKRFFDACLMLNKNGFLTPKIIATGEYKTAGVCTNNFVITEEIQNSINLYQAIEGIPDLKELAKQLGQTTGQMHAKGIFHGDLRLGNILVKNENNKYQFYLLDNERTRKFRKIPQRLIAKNLVQLNMLHININSSVKMKFVKTYFSNGWKVYKKLLTGVINRTNDRLYYGEIKKKSKLNFAGDSRFINFRNSNYSCCIKEDFCKTENFNINKFVSQLDILMEKGELIKNDRKTTISRIKLADKDVVIKRYNYISPIYSILHFFEKSRALRSFRFGNLLLQMGVATPRPLGYIEIKKAGLTIKSYIITEFVKDENLHFYKTKRSLSNAEWINTLGKIKYMINIMAKYRVSHGDIKISNIMVGKNHITITDLDSMKFHKTRTMFARRRTKDLNCYYNKILEKYS